MLAAELSLGEDGLLGICDRECRLCFSFAFWNTRDDILKERLFGLSGPEGNHGEDVKEVYFYVDATPTHSYMKGIYKYPQCKFPYEQLTSGNRQRNRLETELELRDLGVFDDSNYFDCVIEYAKNSPDDILIRATIHNRSAQAGGDSCFGRSGGSATLGLGTVRMKVVRPSRASVCKMVGRVASHATWKSG